MVPARTHTPARTNRFAAEQIPVRGTTDVPARGGAGYNPGGSAGRCGVARMEYDLIRLFEHPLYMLDLIPAAIVTFGGGGVSQRVIAVEWRRSAGAPVAKARLTLTWDLDALRINLPMIDRQLRSYHERDYDQATRTEMAAIVVAAAVLAHIEPETRFTARSDTGSGHDYYLNETTDEMIEVAGEWRGGLPGLFRKK